MFGLGFGCGRNCCMVSSVHSPTLNPYHNTKHSDQAMSKMHEFFEAGQLCDVTLIADNETIRAHRVVLSSASSYFAAMFNSDLLESKSDTVNMKDVCGEALKELVAYAYTGKINITESNVEIILSAACLLSFMDVVEVCCEFLKNQIDINNCIGIAIFADSRNCTDLRDIAFNHAVYHFLQVCEQQEFLEIDYSEVIKILKCDFLNVSGEDHVFKAMMKWINHDKENRMQYMKNLLACVKLPLLSPRYIAEQVTPVVGEEGKDLVIEALEYHLLPHKRATMDSFRTNPRNSYFNLIFAISGSGAALPEEPLNAAPKLGFCSYEVYNPWIDMWVSGSKNKKFVQHAITSIGSNVYVAGGREGLLTLNQLDCFNVMRKDWIKLQCMSTPRHGLGLAAILPNGPLYAIGGHDGWSYLKSVERWDPELDSWSYVEPLSTVRSLSGVAVIDNKIYVVGGRNRKSCLNSVEVYDPICNKWKQCAPMLKKRAGVAVVALDGLLYAFGGYENIHDGPPKPKRRRHSAVERYDPIADKWAIITKMEHGRDGIGIALLGTRILTAGGFDGISFTSIVETYDPYKNEWKKLRDMNTARAGHFLTSVVTSPDVTENAIPLKTPQVDTIPDTTEDFEDEQEAETDNIDEDI